MTSQVNLDAVARNLPNTFGGRPTLMEFNGKIVPLLIPLQLIDDDRLHELIDIYHEVVRDISNHIESIRANNEEPLIETTTSLEVAMLLLGTLLEQQTFRVTVAALSPSGK